MKRKFIFPGKKNVFPKMNFLKLIWHGICVRDMSIWVWGNCNPSFESFTFNFFSSLWMFQVKMNFWKFMLKCQFFVVFGGNFAENFNAIFKCLGRRKYGMSWVQLNGNFKLFKGVFLSTVVFEGFFRSQLMLVENNVSQTEGNWGAKTA